MPHVTISMIPGRDDKAKLEIAKKTQEFLMKELSLEGKFISVSIDDIPMDKWDEFMGKVPKDTIFVEPGV